MGLVATGTEIFTLKDGGTVGVPKVVTVFSEWTGAKLRNTFGGKPVVDVSGSPAFAEIAIADTLAQSGYSVRWAETYARGGRLPMFLTRWEDRPYKEQAESPIAEQWVLDTLAGIASLNGGSYSGCWDVVAWKDEKILFAESKRSKRDRIRASQIAWLEEGLRYGLKPENFLVVQWDFPRDAERTAVVNAL